MSILIEGITKEDFFRILLAARCGMFQKGECDSYYGHKVKELPPHGRLIDADALLSKEPDVHVFDYKVDVIEDGYSENMIQKEPTIIEAEGVKE